jgi:poly(glycerol-phosphate) alpha-glucosyltransferase
MFKHVHLTQSLDPSLGGGLATSVLSLHRAMLSIGLDSLIVSTYRYSLGPLTGQLPPSTYCYRETFPSPFFFSFDLFSARKLLFEYPTIYHSHGLHTFVQFLFRHSVLPKHSRLVIHPHGFLDPYIVNRSQLKKKIVGLLFENRSLSYANAWRALTSVEASQIRSHYQSPAVFTLPNGATVDRSHPLKPKDISPRITQIFSEGRNVLLFMGRLHPKKGLDILIKSWATVAKSFPRWSLIIAGPSSSASYDKQLFQLIKQLDVANILFVGPVYHSDREFLLRKSSAFVLPSYSEGFPMAVLEAAAYSLPLIVTSTSNVPDLCRDNMGLMCEPTVSSLSSCIKTLLNEPKARLEERSHNLSSYVEKYYSWHSIAKSLNQQCIDHLL